MFNEGSYDDRTQKFVLSLEKNLATVNITLIVKRDNSNFTDLCSMGIFICIHGACHFSEGFKAKRNFISDNEAPFSEDCPRTITRLCYHGKCYCQRRQNVKVERSAKKFKVISGGGTAGSSASKFRCDYFLFFISVLLFLNENDYLY